jgi:hypothetical protein
MNPFAIYMIGIPIVLSAIASILKRRIAKWILLVMATSTYWVLLVQYVDWSYTHPFNPNDGGPRAFSAVFGWLIGVVTVILPTYLISKFLQCFWHKKHRRRGGANKSLKQTGDNLRG